MNRALLPVVTFVAAFASAPVGGASAQRAVTVSGHVTSRGAPLSGAHVRVDAAPNRSHDGR